jgi:hypothetical protein
MASGVIGASAPPATTMSARPDANQFHVRIATASIPAEQADDSVMRLGPHAEIVRQWHTDHGIAAGEAANVKTG